MNPDNAWCFSLLALCIWREARGEVYDAKQGVAWSIRNRVMEPCWWGSGWDGVILKPWQYSSFNSDDPNATKVPMLNSDMFADCLNAAVEAFQGNGIDPTSGATHYFDKSLDAKPPSWATDGSMVKTCDLGALHFFKVSQCR